MNTPINESGGEGRLREAPAKRFDFDRLVFDMHAELAALRTETAPNFHGHRQKALFKHSDRTVALFAFDPGGALSEHSANGTVTIEVLEGELLASVGGDELALRPGQLMVIAPGTKHAVTAKAAAGFLLQVSLVT